MKKIILLFLLFISISNAQFIKSYGLKVGLTQSSEAWKYNSELRNFETDKKTGLNAGIFVEFIDNPFVSILSEFSYNQKGMRYEIDKTTLSNPNGSSGKISIHNRVDYLTLSFALKLNYETPLLTPYLFAGPYIDILLGQKTANGWGVIYKDFKRKVPGLKVGIGAELLNILPIAILAEIQLNHNFDYVFKSENLNIENNSFEFKVGIKL